jgi:predicted AlkP superfamily phosphohydrolase/phosphomutase
METGQAHPLPSTVPAMTFPSWTAFLTGLTPGEHGLFDFTQKVAGRYRVRFTNAGDRSGASLFRRVCDAGGSVLGLGVPATFPPEPVRGLLVCGFDAPVSASTDARSTSDPELYRAVASETGPWKRPDLEEGAEEEGWHERAVDVLCERIARKTRFALEALRRLRERGDAPDLFAIVFAESDTVAHHYWRDHDEASPRREESASAKRRGAVAAVYEALDAACGELRRAFGEEAACFVVSDHGSGGASRHVVHLNRRLAAAGLLERRASGGFDLWARRSRDALLRVLPGGVVERAFRRLRPAAARVESLARFGGLDWSRTRAFSEEVNTQPGVWINCAGREEAGCVAPEDYEKTRDEVIATLLDWKLPNGEPVVVRARRREEVYRGPHVERAPDVVVELGSEGGYGLALVATPWDQPGDGLHRLSDDALGGGRGRGMNGVHRPDGVWISTDSATRRPASIVDTNGILLAALGLTGSSDADAPGSTGRAYTAEEEALVAERLRKLGYLE